MVLFHTMIHKLSSVLFSAERFIKQTEYIIDNGAKIGKIGTLKRAGTDMPHHLVKKSGRKLAHAALQKL